MERYFTKSQNELEQFQNLVLPDSKIIITCHQSPDGDAFGSSLGLKFFLEKRGCTNVTVISPTDYAEYIAWMPGVPEIQVYAKGKYNTQIKEADCIFCLDFSSASRLKDMATEVLASPAIKIVIDHHENPEDFGTLYYWNVKASSTSELVYSMIEDLGQNNLIGLESATCLYTGLLTDSGSFRFPSTTPKVHLIAAALLAKGVNPNEVHRQLYDNKPFEKLKFLGYVLDNKLVYLPEYRVAYITLTIEEFERFNSNPRDTDGLVNYGLTIEGVAMSVLFAERDGIIKISFRSIHNFSVEELARKYFEGGGHKNASGGRSALTLEETVEKFLTLLPEFKTKLLSQPK